MVVPSDFEPLVGRALTGDEETEIQMYIDFAIGEIEAWLGRPVTLTQFEDEQVLPDANGACYFKNTPVVSVESLTISGDVISTPSDFVTLTPYGFDNLWEQSNLATPPLTLDAVDRVGYYGAEVLVSYTAGLDFPQAVKSLVTRGVLKKFKEELGSRARLNSGHIGLKKIQVEDFMTEYERPLASSRSSGTSSIAIFESETDFWSIRRYKRRSVT